MERQSDNEDLIAKMLKFYLYFFFDCVFYCFLMEKGNKNLVQRKKT